MFKKNVVQHIVVFNILLHLTVLYNSKVRYNEPQNQIYFSMIQETTVLAMSLKDLEVFVQNVTNKTMASVQATYNISEAAKYLNVSRKTIYNYMERGTLTPLRNNLGKVYFTKTQLDEALD